MKPFLDRSSVLRNVRLPREEDIRPNNPRCLRYSLVTRPELQWTPSQLQRGTLVCQDVKACLESLVMACLKSSSEIMSVLLSWIAIVEEEQRMLPTPQERSSNESSVRMEVSLAG